jgi:hypothetical protein
MYQSVFTIGWIGIFFWIRIKIFWSCWSWLNVEKQEGKDKRKKDYPRPAINGCDCCFDDSKRTNLSTIINVDGFYLVAIFFRC